MRDEPLFFVALFACLAVLVVLMIGVGGFAKGGEFNKKYANKLMQLRLLLQFVAVMVILAFVYFTQGS